MLTRQQIRQFLAVVDTGSFTRAAEAIGVTQPTLSSGIRELETHVGASLFDRQRPFVRLTSAGNRLLPIARRISREFLRAERETAQVAPANRPFVLGVFPSFPSSRLASGCKQWGSAQLTIRERDETRLRQELRQGQTDAAIVIRSGGEPDNLRFIDLFIEDYLMMLPCDHPLATRKMIQAEELADEVMIARRSCELLGYTSDYFTSRGVRPRFSFKSHNDDRALSLVAAGIGVTVAPASLIVEKVIGIKLADFNARRNVAIAVRKDDYDLGGLYRQNCIRLAQSFSQK